MEVKLQPFDPSSTVSVEESCIKFAEILGLERPVPESVMLSALNDATYAHNLIVCRSAPQFLEHLLKNPPVTAKPGESASASETITANEKTNLELLKKASVALWNWGKIGFSVVDEETYERRHSACMGCEYLVDPPQKMLYKLTSRKSTEQKVCNLCGCSVAKKAKLPSEKCPSRHKSIPGLNRWEEPFD